MRRECAFHAPSREACRNRFSCCRQFTIREASRMHPKHTPSVRRTGSIYIFAQGVLTCSGTKPLKWCDNQGFCELSRRKSRPQHGLRCCITVSAKQHRSHRLKEIPQGLVVNPVVELHLATLHNGSKQLRAAVGRRFLQVRITPLHIRTENLPNPR